MMLPISDSQPLLSIQEVEDSISDAEDSKSSECSQIFSGGFGTMASVIDRVMKSNKTHELPKWTISRSSADKRKNLVVESILQYVKDESSVKIHNTAELEKRAKYTRLVFEKAIEDAINEESWARLNADYRSLYPYDEADDLSKLWLQVVVRAGFAKSLLWKRRKYCKNKEISGKTPWKNPNVSQAIDEAMLVVNGAVGATVAAINEQVLEKSPKQTVLDDSKSHSSSDVQVDGSKHCRLCMGPIVSTLSTVEFILNNPPDPLTEIDASSAREVADACKGRVADCLNKLIPKWALALKEKNPHAAHSKMFKFEADVKMAIIAEAWARINENQSAYEEKPIVYPEQVTTQAELEAAITAVVETWLMVINRASDALAICYKDTPQEESKMLEESPERSSLLVQFNELRSFAIKTESGARDWLQFAIKTSIKMIPSKSAKQPILPA